MAWAARRNGAGTAADDMKMDRGTDPGSQSSDESERWPALPCAEWRETCQTLHLWTQIVGKVRLELSPHVNHWWLVPLYVWSRGLTTSPIPYQGEIFEVTFDLLDHNLAITTSSGGVKQVALMPRSVAEFYDEFLTALGALVLLLSCWEEWVVGIHEGTEVGKTSREMGQWIEAQPGQQEAGADERLEQEP